VDAAESGRGGFAALGRGGGGSCGRCGAAGLRLAGGVARLTLVTGLVDGGGIPPQAAIASYMWSSVGTKSAELEPPVNTTKQFSFIVAII
jgi:hypothetical protein